MAGLAVLLKDGLDVFVEVDGRRIGGQGAADRDCDHDNRRSKDSRTHV
jgi:hypothetical protein